jgi:hypothetical protein
MQGCEKSGKGVAVTPFPIKGQLRCSDNSQGELLMDRFKRLACATLASLMAAVGVERPLAEESSATVKAGETTSPEEEKPEFFTLTTSAAIYSSYMFRAQNIYDGLSFQPSLQGTFNFEEYGNVSLIHWMHLPAQGEQYETRYVEMDEGLSYDISFDDFTFSLTHYWYLYPNGNANTFPGSRELIATLSWDNTFLQPYVTFANEYRAYKVQYYEVGIKHTFELAHYIGLDLTVFANTGFVTNGMPYWAKNSGLVQASGGVSTDIELGPVTITPLLAYANGNDGYATDQWWGGVNFSTSL